jgi:hypothetical protein
MTDDEKDGMTWWNDLSPEDRLFWLRQADSAIPAAAWEAFKRLVDGDTPTFISGASNGF